MYPQIEQKPKTDVSLYYNMVQRVGNCRPTEFSANSVADNPHIRAERMRYNSEK